jgi:hypothetical protein
MSYVKLKSVFLGFLERWFSLGARDFDALMERCGTCSLAGPSRGMT